MCKFTSYETDDNTCLVKIFKQDFKAAAKLCERTVLPKTESTVPIIQRDDMHVISANGDYYVEPKGNESFDIVCPTSNGQSKRTTYFNRHELAFGCYLSTDHMVSFIAHAPANVTSRAMGVNTDLNFEDLLSPLHVEELKTVLPSEEAGPMPLSEAITKFHDWKLAQEMGTTLNFEPHTAPWLTDWSISIMLLILALVLLYCELLLRYVTAFYKECTCHDYLRSVLTLQPKATQSEALATTTASAHPRLRNVDAQETATQSPDKPRRETLETTQRHSCYACGARRAEVEQATAPLLSEPILSPGDDLTKQPTAARRNTVRFHPLPNVIEDDHAEYSNIE